MSHATRIRRNVTLAAGLSVLAVGLAVGAVPRAAADPFPPPFDPNDFAISIDGFTLFQVGTATATSGIGDFAIADGAGSLAIADGGFGDFASALGADSFAVAGSNVPGTTDNNFDFASALGPSTQAAAGLNGSFDSASAVGYNVTAHAGIGTTVVPADFDFASILANLAAAPSNLSFAESELGTGDLAFVVDPFGTLGTQVFAGLGGDFNVAGAFIDDVNVVSAFNDFVFHIAPFF
ncbi:hypothetical protein MSP7336_03834 [Mycobacterium shimoidei]|uniref:Uncharacterized protein n=1 Tax=Mycobacterium shimoidei TaxID=29313 RepID=A0A375Z3K1_MYCSH|nr:hypothetical protein MSP7336_03834 [Mycobacterium shimoidei]